MSSTPLDRLVEKLLDRGIAADKWVAVIEQATTPMQRVTAGPIHEFPIRSGIQYASPTLIIIGRVASLHADFQWLADGHKDGLYFPSLLEPAPAIAIPAYEPLKKITIC
jgi:hypothetical protein